MQTEVVRFYAILPTAFGADGGPDVPAMLEDIAQMVEHGVRGVLLTGSYGEFQSLEHDERVAIAEAVVAKSGMSSVMVGAAALNHRDAVTVGRRLLDCGADQVMVSPPFAAEMTDGDLERHFAAIGEQLGRNLVVYNNPVFGVDLSPALLERVVEDPAYVSIKQGTKSLASMVDLIARVQVPDRAQVLAAADLACAAAVGAGAGGVTSTNVWVFPRAFLRLADPGVAPEEKGRLLAALQPYAAAVRSLGQPRAVKAAMQLRGYAGGAAVRLPYAELDAEETTQLRSAVDRSDAALAELGVSA